MNKHIDISMSLKVISDRLKQALEKAKEPHAELISRVIIEHLETTEMGLSQLLQAYMGMEETVDWIVGDECMIDTEKVSSWESKKEMNEAAGLIYKGHYKGIVKDIDLRKKKSITFEFEGFRYDSDTKTTKIKIEVKPESLKREADFQLARPGASNLL